MVNGKFEPVLGVVGKVDCAPGLASRVASGVVGGWADGVVCVWPVVVGAGVAGAGVVDIVAAAVV